MNRGLRVAMPPPKPLLVFDGDCHFCTLWVRRGQQLTGDAVDYLPAQDPRIAQQFPEIPPAQFAKAVQYIGTDGTVCSGAEAVFRTLVHRPCWQWPLKLYEAAPLFARVTGRAYRYVAEHRPVFSALTRWGWGEHVEAPTHFLTRWLFLRAMGAIWLVAFLSCWMQVNGLIGHNGILPADRYMAALKQQCDTQGIGLERYHLVPTLCWWDASNTALQAQCVAGIVLAVLLIFGLAPAPCLALLWLLYLSLVTVGRDFYGFQWDNLLLETGFLAIFLAPRQQLPGINRETAPSRLFVWLLRLLLFKLMFSSGCVKLLSGDPAWRNLTALTFHYQTQPLPTWIGWYAHQAPVWFQKLSCVVMFAIELGAPFLIFTPRRLRFTGAALLAGLQLIILLTGNYTFFNYLTLALCLLLLDDFALARFFQRRWNLESRPPQSNHPTENLNVRSRRGNEALYKPTTPLPPNSVGQPCSESDDNSPSPRGEGRGEGQHVKPTDNSRPLVKPVRRHYLAFPRPVLIMIALIWLIGSTFMLAETLGFHSALLTPFGWVARELSPFRSINNYGLFAVMTTQRNEIIVEGSNDGATWRPYEFKYKPGNLNHRPAFVAPFQPRLDWQMWFAALGSAEQNPWFTAFCERLLQGSPDVLTLLAVNPFPDHPPRYIRAEFYDYQFTDFGERRTTDAWWQRTLVGEYLPPVSLRE